MMIRTGLALSFIFVSSCAWGNARLVTPVPRTPDPGIKVAPCGPAPKLAVPNVNLVGGATLAVAWQETINHPGKFIFTWLQENETPMVGVAPVLIPDNQDGGGLPHNYTAQLTVPNVDCTNCVLQLVQSMEENPAAPTYYYSCVDVRISLKSAPTPPPVVGGGPPQAGDPAAQSSVLKFEGEKNVVSSCGMVAIGNGGRGPGAGFGAGPGILLFALPLLMYLILRSRRRAATN